MATLVLLYPDSAEVVKEFPLPAHEAIVGRDNDCAVHIDSSSVSRRHAKIYFDGDAWFVEDLQSTNGCFVNDVPIVKSVLRDCDALKVGNFIFKFQVAGAFEVPGKTGNNGEGGTGAPAVLGVPKPSRN